MSETADNIGVVPLRPEDRLRVAITSPVVRFPYRTHLSHLAQAPRQSRRS